MRILGEIFIGISMLLFLIVFGLYLFIILSYYIQALNRHVTAEYPNPQAEEVIKALKKWGWVVFVALLLFVSGVFIRGES